MTEREILKQSIDAHQVAINKARLRLKNLSDRFEIRTSGGGTLKIRTHAVSVEFGINDNAATASISEAYKIREALSRLIALAERNQ